MLFKVENGYFKFRCPGCKYVHAVPVEGQNGHAWELKIEDNVPTLTPSLKETRGHFVPKQPQPPDCPMCNDTHDGFYRCGCCHLFVTKGKIEFCADSTHELAGKTVGMVSM